MKDPKRRFSNVAGDYARYRPGYPRAILELLETECGLTTGSVVADVASGTGLLSELFLANGNRVFGVEPNDEMREAGERYLVNHSAFASIAGTAEGTTLGSSSVDFVVVGHAFHWFEAGAARAEFERILRTPGWVVLLWNEQRKGGTPFLAAYERLIQAYKTEEYKPFDLRKEVEGFFEPAPFESRTFEHHQTFDLDGLKGRLLSSSYVPGAGEPGHAEMIRDLEALFRARQKDGLATIEYQTLVFYGSLG